MSSLKDRRRRGTEHAFTASGLDKTGDIVAQINAPKTLDTPAQALDVQDKQDLLDAPVLAEVQDQVKTINIPESAAEKVIRRLTASRKTHSAAVEEERDSSLSVAVENHSLSASQEINVEVVTLQKSDEGSAQASLEGPYAASEDEQKDEPQVVGVSETPLQRPVDEVDEVVEAAVEPTGTPAPSNDPQAPTQTAVEPPSSPPDAKPALTAWEKLAAINASAKRSAPSSRRYIAHVPSELFDACRVLRGDWPITTWFVSLVAKYHDQVVKGLVGSTPDASLGVVPRRVYRKQEGSTKCFLLYFANTELGLAQQAFFEECLSSAGTTTEYVVAVLQSHVDASRAVS
jgi:hypothetical protein